MSASQSKFVFCRSPLSAFCFAALFAFQLALGAPSARAEVSDPIEPVNRGIFWFNDKLDTYILEPVARGYDDYIPKPIRNGIRNFFINIRTPIYVVSDVVQLKFSEAGTHTGRFLINSTIGGLGFVDVASDFGLRHEREDFGVALGYHGVGEGPYLVLPILGPSNLRDLFGRIVDSFLNPVNYADEVSDDGEAITIGATVIEGIDDRSRLLEAVEAAKDASVDYYSFVKNSYHQHRQNVIYDNNPPEEPEEEFEDDASEVPNVVDPVGSPDPSEDEMKEGVAPQPNPEPK